MNPSKIKNMVYKKSHIISFAVLFFLLVVVLLNIQNQQQIKQSATTTAAASSSTPGAVTPTFGCVGGVNCIPSISPSPTPDVSLTVPVEATPEVSSTPPVVVSPTLDPCAGVQNVASANHSADRHEKKQNSSLSNLLQLLLQFFQQLINMLLQLIGGGTINITPVSPTPTTVQATLTPQPTLNITPVSPTPTTVTVTLTPQPTLNPCLKITPHPTQSNPTPTIFGMPTATPGITSTPTPAVVPTGSTTLQPAVTYARPGGGQWNLAFHDEFDGSGGTTADAMSGANFVNKTVGGGALAGNPGLNPRKWNMGWQTGPDTLDGLGMVTTSTTGMCPNGCTENDWYGVESLVFPGDGALHMRSQNKTGTAPNPERNTTSTSNNEEGMITTAGLLALNPAKSSHGSVAADRFVDGPQILEWKVSNIFLIDWPAFWLANCGYFGHAGSQWPGGTSFQEEIDLLEPVFRMHVASEFQSGKEDIPSGWDENATLTMTWFFDVNRIILWVTDASGKQVKQIDIPDSEVTASMISAQWKLPQYLFIQQKTLQKTAGYGDWVLDYVRIWN